MKRSFNAAQVPHAIALESVQVASPCHADWNAMNGDDRSRFCPSCAKNVYNLSAMTRSEAELLLQEKEGRLCVRFFQREDGTMLTQDCPVGVAALKERSPSFALWAGVASLLVVVGALISPSFIAGAQAQPDPSSGGTPAQTVTPTPEPTATAIAEPQYPAMMGDIAPVPRPTATPSTTIATLGEAIAATPNATASTPEPTATPAQLVPLMGKPCMPTATPAPHASQTRMGRSQIVPAPIPVAKQVPPPLMGMIAYTPPKPPASPKKAGSTPKKGKKASTKRR